MTPDPDWFDGFKLSNILGGAVGGLISLNFHEGLTRAQKVTTVFGGWGMAAMLTPSIVDYLQLRPVWNSGLSFLLGLFGMSLTAAILNALKSVDWAAMIKEVWDKWVGGKS